MFTKKQAEKIAEILSKSRLDEDFFVSQEVSPDVPGGAGLTKIEKLDYASTEEAQEAIFAAEIQFERVVQNITEMLDEENLGELDRSFFERRCYEDHRK